jgi:protein-disulfide isomerase
MNHKKFTFGFRVTVAAAATLMLAACGDSSETGDTATPATDAVATDAASTVPAEAQGEGTWGDIVYGDPNAPVTIVEYASLTCPHCATFARSYFPKLQELYLDTGKAKLHYRNYIMNRVDIAASAAARCGNADVTKKLMKLYFSRQGDWARSSQPLDELAALARRVGISRTQFDACVGNEDMLKHLMAMTNEGNKKYGVNSTPSFLVNGELLEFNTFEEAMELIAEAVKDAG